MQLAPGMVIVGQGLPVLAAGAGMVIVGQGLPVFAAGAGASLPYYNQPPRQLQAQEGL